MSLVLWKILGGAAFGERPPWLLYGARRSLTGWIFASLVLDGKSLLALRSGACPFLTRSSRAVVRRQDVAPAPTSLIFYLKEKPQVESCGVVLHNRIRLNCAKRWLVWWLLLGRIVIGELLGPPRVRQFTSGCCPFVVFGWQGFRVRPSPACGCVPGHFTLRCHRSFWMDSCFSEFGQKRNGGDGCVCVHCYPSPLFRIRTLDRFAFHTCNSFDRPFAQVFRRVWTRCHVSRPAVLVGSPCYWIWTGTILRGAN